MTAYREEPKQEFKPVTLTLNTQAEVDGIYTLLLSNRLTSTVGLDDTNFMALRNFADLAEADRLFRKVQEVVK
jgi:hypothetical protein